MTKRVGALAAVLLAACAASAGGVADAAPAACPSLPKAVALCGGAIASRLIGHDGARPFPYGATGVGQNIKPVGAWTRIPSTGNTYANDYGDLVPPPKGTPTTLFVLGGDGSLGRDEFIR